MDEVLGMSEHEVARGPGTPERGQQPEGPVTLNVTRLKTPVATALAVVILAWPSRAAAQVVPQATPQTTAGCAEYQVTMPPKGPIQIDVTRLQECIEALRGEISTSPAYLLVEGRSLTPGQRAETVLLATEAAEQAAPGVTEVQRHFKLKKIYLAYARIRAWKDCALRIPEPGTSRRCSPMTRLEEPDRSRLEEEFGLFAEQLHVALKGHGLTQPFAATLVTAFAFQNTGDATETGADPGGPVPLRDGGNSGSGSSAAGYVVFESVHFFARPDRRFDLDITGTIGFRPALALLEPDGEDAALVAEYKQAFVWSVAAEPNWRVADLAEVGVFVGGGQTILNSAHSLIENGANSQVGVTASGETGASFIEFGAKVGIFAETLDLLHLSKGLLSPMLGFSVGLRRDQRFKDIVLPEGLGNPRDRMFVRLSTSAIPLADSARPDQTFTLTFSIEHEWARTTGRGAVPQGTRVLVRGDLNLFKATAAR